MKHKGIFRAAGVLIAVAASAPALATNGYFLHGYGAASAAMGGVGYALPQDALAPASNPAGLPLVGDRLDVGLDWFTPRRGATLYGNQSIAPQLNSGSVLGGGSGLTGPDAIGGSYQPKIHMRRFTKYAGLFAGHGVFDVPENYGGGIA